MKVLNIEILYFPERGVYYRAKYFENVLVKGISKRSIYVK